MKPIDGFELLTLLKRYPAARKIPVIILTGRDNPLYIDKALEFGVEDYLIKPIQPRDLLDRIKSVVPPQKVTPSTPIKSVKPTFGNEYIRGVPVTKSSICVYIPRIIM